jgi:hypothetical protein
VSADPVGAVFANAGVVMQRIKMELNKKRLNIFIPVQYNSIVNTKKENIFLHCG